MSEASSKSTDPRSFAQRAKVIKHGGAGPYNIEIDGQPFPWFTVDGVVAATEKGGLTTLTVSIAIEQGVTIEQAP
jgi:hypothetical protein